MNIRTQVYLTEEQKRTIELRARQERKPEAQVIRELVDSGLAAEPAGYRKTASQGLMALVALGKKYGATGPTDLSTNHDDYLYGDKT